MNPLPEDARSDTRSFGNVVGLAIQFEIARLDNVFTEADFQRLSTAGFMDLFHRLEEVREVTLKGDLSLQPFELPSNFSDVNQYETGIRLWCAPQSRAPNPNKKSEIQKPSTKPKKPFLRNIELS